MPNRSADALFQLIKSMEKSEKRNFKLYTRRNSGTEELKTITLFDALDKMPLYDEQIIFKKAKGIKKQQLSNLKAGLYKQILGSLRLIKDEENIDLRLHEQMDYARILYNKGLYMQSLKILDKLKETSKEFQQLTYLQQALFFEKKIEGLFITRSMQDRAEKLSQESNIVSSQIFMVNQLSNLSLQLYSWYIQNGHARNQQDIDSVRSFFENNLPPGAIVANGFYEKLYLYQSYVWYAFICQDFLHYYRYSQKWVDLFSQKEAMKKVEPATFIKGIHNLMSAEFNLIRPDKLAETIKEFEKFTKLKFVRENENTRVLAFQYLYTARLNLCFLEGNFTSGLRMVPHLETLLKEYSLYLDKHRILVFYYKIACLYFGSGDNARAIDLLNLIINQKGNLRTDLQCYARLLHLIAHYELGNFEILEHLIKSVYRFMANMQSLSKVEENIFTFLRRSFKVGAHALKPEFENLLIQLKDYQGNALESRAFVYLDVISWLESKINDVSLEDVVRIKYAEKNRR
jgi:hypothetical protein